MCAVSLYVSFQSTLLKLHPEFVPDLHNLTLKLLPRSFFQSSLNSAGLKRASMNSSCQVLTDFQLELSVNSNPTDG